MRISYTLQVVTSVTETLDLPFTYLHEQSPSSFPKRYLRYYYYSQHQL